MSEPQSLGDQLFGILKKTQGDMFKSVELAQLAYNSFKYVLENVPKNITNELEVQYPIGVNLADGSQVLGKAKYTKESFIQHHVALAESALPIQGIYGLVQSIENMLGAILCAICKKYPKKVGEKRQISLESILKCESLEAVQTALIYDLLNELSYKSPRDFAKQSAEITGVQLLEIPAFHRYVELKATRDIHIHNQGIANDIYLRKADSHARVKVGDPLPVTISYYMHSYEYCLQLTEALEKQFHDIWPSDLYLREHSKSSASAVKPLDEVVAQADKSDDAGKNTPTPST